MVREIILCLWKEKKFFMAKTFTVEKWESQDWVIEEAREISRRWIIKVSKVVTEYWPCLTESRGKHWRMLSTWKLQSDMHFRKKIQKRVGIWELLERKIDGCLWFCERFYEATKDKKGIKINVQLCNFPSLAPT